MDFKKLEEEIKKDKSETPESSGSVSVLPPSAELETKVKDLEGKQNILAGSLDAVRHTNTFVLVVLLIGFITMFVAFITMLILAFNSTSTAQVEFIKAVQQLNDKIIVPTP